MRSWRQSKELAMENLVLFLIFVILGRWNGLNYFTIRGAVLSGVVLRSSCSSSYDAHGCVMEFRPQSWPGCACGYLSLLAKRGLSCMYSVGPFSCRHTNTIQASAMASSASSHGGIAVSRDCVSHEKRAPSSI